MKARLLHDFEKYYKIRVMNAIAYDFKKGGLLQNEKGYKGIVFAVGIDTAGLR